MSIGLGVFLVALGAVLSFAVQDRLSGIDLVMVGYICMAAGVATIILSFVLANQRRRGADVVERTTEYRDPQDPYGRP
ncbi:low affinity Fe/Cu permease [Kineosphaera limosa]|uniref:DUF6458 domain-containing protein n=1 Tax=Kineosphaera limosa NBRC 100340 TaxID=1184609 RepID=K6WYF4_9MICO|nr:DUF6458 family protein [Kineosphaera limosa]NYE00339.1 low affinity Fe/Cu permease [Kineosphaera limosa]GAB97137.1 hypothetical protein KILIM_057_00280 [Kineosphaera limosa NBRC 100340]